MLQTQTINEKRQLIEILNNLQKIRVDVEFQKERLDILEDNLELNIIKIATLIKNKKEF